jgi:hypothetical protein
MPSCTSLGCLLLKIKPHKTENKECWWGCERIRILAVQNGAVTMINSGKTSTN